MVWRWRILADGGAFHILAAGTQFSLSGQGPPTYFESCINSSCINQPSTKSQTWEFYSCEVMLALMYSSKGCFLCVPPPKRYKQDQKRSDRYSYPDRIFVRAISFHQHLTHMFSSSQIHKETVTAWPWRCRHNLNQKLRIHEVGLSNQENCRRKVRKRFEYGIEQAGYLRGKGMACLMHFAILSF